MQWIKFSDIKPPIDMEVVVSTGETWSILYWKKEFNDCDHTYIDVYNCTKSLIPVWEIEYWAPLYFMNNYLPDNFIENNTLKSENNWYESNKNNNLMQKLTTAITKHNSGSKLSPYSEGCKKKRYVGEVGRLKELFIEIENPGYIDSLDKGYEAFLSNMEGYNPMFLNAELNLKELISFRENLNSKKSVIKTSGRILRMRRYHPCEPDIYFKHKISGEIRKGTEQISLRFKDMWELYDKNKPKE